MLGRGFFAKQKTACLRTDVIYSDDSSTNVRDFRMLGKLSKEEAEMKFPRIVNWLAWKNNPDGTYRVRDCAKNKEYIISPEVFEFARKLDGEHDPFTVMPELSAEDVRKMLDALDAVHLLRRSNVLEKMAFAVYQTLWIPRHSRAKGPVPSVLNLLRQAFWFPVFVVTGHANGNRDGNDRP